MWSMFVTRDVSQPEMSALKLRVLSKRLLMSVTPETHQSAMAPYVAIAEDAFESYFLTAMRREALFAKVLLPVQAGGKGGDGGEGGGGEGGGGDGGEGDTLAPVQVFLQ